jgi:hypothetical protein
MTFFVGFTRPVRYLVVRIGRGCYTPAAHSIAMGRDVDRASRELAALTAGVLNIEMARAVGLVGHVRKRRVQAGEWSMPTPRVLVLEGAPATFERDAWIGIYAGGAGAALTHDTGLARFHLPGFSERPIHVTHDRPQLIDAVEGVIFHRSRLWPVDHRILLNGMPVATPTRALFDVANEGEIHPKRLERAINNAWARGLTSGELLEEMAKEWCRRGREGSTLMREYLAGHPIDWQPPESNLEDRFKHVITEAGLPEPVRQRNVGDSVSWIGRVDVKDPQLPLIGEIQSDLFHTAPLDCESDAERVARLEAAGFHVETFPEREVWYDKDAVVEKWRKGREIARTLRRTGRAR